MTEQHMYRYFGAVVQSSHRNVETLYHWQEIDSECCKMSDLRFS
jgi:hypothetical protein